MKLIFFVPEVKKTPLKLSLTQEKTHQYCCEKRYYFNIIYSVNYRDSNKCYARNFGLKFCNVN